MQRAWRALRRAAYRALARNLLTLDSLVYRFEVAVAQGAKIVLGGDGPEGASTVLNPTGITDITPSNPAYHQEFFGPVAIFFRARNEEYAIAIANASPFGLGGR